MGLGALAIVAALAYTGGPWPYGYRGLGEVFVFVFFGLVAVAGTAYLQALRFEPLFVVAAIPVGALMTAILVVNNLRDIPTDRAAGKRTLAVLVGRRATAAEYALLLLAAFIVPIVLVVAGFGIVQLLPLASAPLVVPLVRTVRDFREPQELNRVLTGHRAARPRLRRALRGRPCAPWLAGMNDLRASLESVPVNGLTAVRVRVPFRRPFATATGMWLHREAWILFVAGPDGRVGVGEAVLEPDATEVEETILARLVREVADRRAVG